MQDRLAPCIYYQFKGKCEKGFKAEQKGICQHCNKYKPRKGYKDNSKDKRRKEKEKYYE